MAAVVAYHIIRIQFPPHEFKERDPSLAFKIEFKKHKKSEMLPDTQYA